MNNKPVVVFICLLLLTGFLNHAGSYLSLFGFLKTAELATVAASMAAVFLLVKHGSYGKSTLFRFAQIFVGITLAGMMFKIMHWQHADVLLIVGPFGVLGLYAAHFFLKPDKSWLDYGKLVWAALLVSGYVFKMQHWPFAKVLSVLENLCLFLVFAGFAMKHYRAQKLVM